MRGTIYDANTGAGLWLAHVVAFELDGTFIGGTVSDAMGDYSLNVPGDLREVLVRVSFVGYADGSEVVSSGTDWYDVELIPAIYEIPEVEIFPEASPSSGAALGLGALLLLLLASDQ